MSEDPDPSQAATLTTALPVISSAGRQAVDVQVSVDDSGWNGIVADISGLVDRVTRATLDHPEVGSGSGHATELSILLSSDERARELNRAYRGRDKPTNVLSFAYSEPGEGADASLSACLGDVILARETVEREAIDQKKTMGDHLSHLIVHGVLHLCGFDHETDAEAEVMERLEREILADMGVADPYGVDPCGSSVSAGGQGG